MDLTKLKNLLVKHEGIKNKPYLDTVGKLTIGVGRNLTDKGISNTTVLQMLEEDLQECIDDLEGFSWFNSLSEPRQMALVDMRFNLGPKGFRTFKNTLKLIEDCKFNEASGNMLASKWAKQVGSRATELAEMIRIG